MEKYELLLVSKDAAGKHKIVRIPATIYGTNV